MGKSKKMKVGGVKLMCPYCGEYSKKVTGLDVYPHRPDLRDLVFYKCDPCDAYVGTHKGTDRPLGRLANKDLRDAKLDLHRVFDPMWRLSDCGRSYAYRWLASELGIRGADCHINMFDIATCKKAIDICVNIKSKGSVLCGGV